MAISDIRANAGENFQLRSIFLKLILNPNAGEKSCLRFRMSLLTYVHSYLSVRFR
jgi:hypothetical protein